MDFGQGEEDIGGESFGRVELDWAGGPESEGPSPVNRTGENLLVRYE